MHWTLRKGWLLHKSCNASIKFSRGSSKPSTRVTGKRRRGDLSLLLSHLRSSPTLHRHRHFLSQSLMRNNAPRLLVLSIVPNPKPRHLTMPLALLLLACRHHILLDATAHRHLLLIRRCCNPSSLVLVLNSLTRRRVPTHLQAS